MKNIERMMLNVELKQTYIVISVLTGVNILQVTQTYDAINTTDTSCNITINRPTGKTCVST